MEKEVSLSFLKSGYMIGGYIPMVRDVYLETGFITEWVRYTKNFCSVYPNGNYCSFGYKKHGFELLSGIEEKDGGV